MSPRLAIALAGVLTAGVLTAGVFTAGATPAQTTAPVAAVVDGRFPVGAAQLPVFVSQDWSRPLPDIDRAVIVVHGFARNAADYARDIMALRPLTDTLVIVPQFLADEDIGAQSLADAVLRWQRELWSGGSPADGPEPLSAFDAVDALLARLADRAAFPKLRDVVLAGFSAGGQLVQRYAIVGRGEPALDQGGFGMHLRYVVGSPSSFAYFTDERPLPDGRIARFPGAAACPDFNKWKYGFDGELPPYVNAVAALGVPGIERRYAERNVVYLVGANDNDPNHRLLDKSCAGEAQGSTRLARTQGFFAELEQREGRALTHRMWIIDGAAHNAAKVFGSPCGRAVLFGGAGCPGDEEKK